MQPFFSIIIPLYNKQNYIEDTLKSVINQSFTNYEIIIVNDGSTDKSLEKVARIKDERIQIYSIENQGVSFARNYAIEKANAPLLVFLDADDTWKENHLELLKTLFNKFPNCGLYATAYAKQTRTLKIHSVYKNIPKQNNWMGIVDDFFESSMVNCIAWTSAVMIPKKIIDNVGNFDGSITLGAGEDTDLWIRIALKYPVAFCNTVTAIHNLYTENRISNANTNIRKFINLDKFENNAKQNISLKKYLDFNRYAIAIQYKLVSNKKKAIQYIDDIDLKNLNWKQRFLLHSNSSVLRILRKFKFKLQQKGINLSSFQ